MRVFCLWTNTHSPFQGDVFFFVKGLSFNWCFKFFFFKKRCTPLFQFWEFHFLLFLLITTHQYHLLYTHLVSNLNSVNVELDLKVDFFLFFFFKVVTSLTLLLLLLLIRFCCFCVEPQKTKAIQIPIQPICLGSYCITRCGCSIFISDIQHVWWHDMVIE